MFQQIIFANTLIVNMIKYFHLSFIMFYLDMKEIGILKDKTKSEQELSGATSKLTINLVGNKCNH